MTEDIIAAIEALVSAPTSDIAELTLLRAPCGSGPWATTLALTRRTKNRHGLSPSFTAAAVPASWPPFFAEGNSRRIIGSLRRPLPPARYGRTAGPPVQYRLLHGGGEFRRGFGMSKPERGSSPKLRKNSARERNFPIRECVPQAQCQAEPEVTAARSRNCWPRTWDLRVRFRTSYHFPGERRIVIG